MGKHVINMYKKNIKKSAKKQPDRHGCFIVMLLNDMNVVKKFHPFIFYSSRVNHVSTFLCLTDRRTFGIKE